MLFRILGGWRTRLVWRFFGLVVLQATLLLWNEARLVGRPDLLPAELAVLAACAALLLLTGPRLVLLAAAALAAFALVSGVILPNPAVYQLAEEYAPFVALPALGVLLVLARLAEARAGALAAARSAPALAALQRGIDAAHVALFRLTLVVVMFFAAFHKLNADFFDPDASCATILGRGPLESLPGGRHLVPALPVAGLLGEALVPLLLLAFPRLGLPFTLVVMSVIGHRGATAFTMLVIALSCAFLREGDAAPLVRGLRRHGRHGLALAAAVALASYVLYRGARPWSEILVFEWVTLAVAFGLAHVLAADLRSRRARDAEHRLDAAAPSRRPELAALLPRGPAVRALLVGAVALGLVNGFAPYLGLKFRLSFAMFSNLRVDESRWNHLLVPRGVHLREHDAFVHVLRVRMTPEEHRLLGSRPEYGHLGVKPGLYAPWSLQARLLLYRQLGVRPEVELRYRGERRRFRDAPNDPALAAWLARLPDGRWFHDALPSRGVQPCMH